MQTEQIATTEWPPLQIPPAKPPLWRRMAGFAAGRIHAAFRRDTAGWRAASAGINVFAAALLAVLALGIPTGFGYAFDAVVLIVLGTAVLWAGGALLAVLFSLMLLPIPRLFAGVALMAGTGGYAALYAAELGWTAAVAAAVYTAAGAGAGALIRALLLARRRPVQAAAALLAAAAVLTAAAGILPQGSSGAVPALASQQADARVRELGIGDPSQPGGFAYRTFTYGSGTDKRRSVFGEGVSVVTQPVDASGYITKWPSLRTRFWGFDQHALPLNGRVWMPEGSGPFPIVLIVHGNHLMEDFSDEGYGYLGELLASRGFIAVSVDENFLNYSVWTGIPNDDMKMRAWLLLHHLREIAELSGTPGTPFYGKTDLSRVGLIGHSRGGQAVAMAADRARWFAKDASLVGLDRIRIESVVAIAPTDTTVDKQAANLRNVNYLTIQGSRDADVHNFYGDEQYVRTSFAEGTDRFKASIYLDGANHGQFNTTWGRYDAVLPGGLLLQTSGMMDAERQRQAAKAYISAFLEATLHGHAEFAELFKDPLVRAHYAGGAAVIGRFESGKFLAVSRFEQPGIRSLHAGVTAKASGTTLWKHEAALNRDGKSRGYDSLALQWDDEAAYRMDFDDRYWQTAHRKETEAFAFSLADLSNDLEASGSFTIEVEIEGIGGKSVRLPLAAFDRLQPLPAITYTIHPLFEHKFNNRKYKSAIEPVFQTFVLPIDAFAAEAPELVKGGIRSVTIRMKGGPGKIMIDDLGFYTRER